MVTIEEMEEMLDALALELPADFYKELNGGIVLLPEALMHEQSKGKDLYIMGQYRRSPNMGRYIVIFYGSFQKVHGGLGREELMDKLRATLRHEFRHHLESLAGERGLEMEDEEDLKAYLERKARGGRPMR
jgi:hypothetical protein